MTARNIRLRNRKKRRAARQRAAADALKLWEASIHHVAAAVLRQACRGNVRCQLEILQRVFGKVSARQRAVPADGAAASLRIIIEDPTSAAGSAGGPPAPEQATDPNIMR